MLPARAEPRRAPALQQCIHSSSSGYRRKSMCDAAVASLQPHMGETQGLTSTEPDPVLSPDPPSASPRAGPWHQWESVPHACAGSAWKNWARKNSAPVGSNPGLGKVKQTRYCKSYVTWKYLYSLQPRLIPMHQIHRGRAAESLHFSKSQLTAGPRKKKINTLSLSYQKCRGHSTLGRPFAEKYSSYQASAAVPVISSKPRSIHPP